MFTQLHRHTCALYALQLSPCACRYDLCDLLAHLYRQLHGGGYEGVPIHAIYRDEASGEGCVSPIPVPSIPLMPVPEPQPSPVQVQDFTQAEMLLDMRVVPDPNRLFYSGDTAQTIARGIGFRFAGEWWSWNEAGVAG